jgi:carbon storage regulator
MLVLARKPREAIVMGNIRIEVVRVAGQKVTLGIEAPREVRILREELVEPESTKESTNN